MADEIRQVAVATVSPTACVRCHSQTGPFADIDVVHFDLEQIYICKLCSDGITRAMGGCTAEEKAGLETQLRDKDDRVEELIGHLAEAKRAAVSEFAEFLRERNGTETAEVAS
jgi:hypothetical protein